MIKCENGVIQVKGYGSEVAPEMGAIMGYYFENCTHKETVVALEEFKAGLSDEAKLTFLTALTMIMQ